MSAEGTADSTERDWYQRDHSETLDAVDADTDGLSSAEADRRRAEVGPNELPKAEAVPTWRIFLRQFKSPLIYILAVAAVVSLAIGEEVDAAFIALVLVVNAVVGGVQEWRAERSSRALQDLIRTRATVIRDGEMVEVDSVEVVPGDILLLESGFRVPADVRLLDTQDLAVNESALTGESEPVEKDADWETTEDLAVGDRKNVAYAGTVVTRGRARGVVVETGVETVVGRLAEAVTTVEGGQPPLVVRMERFTQALSVTVLIAAVFVALMGIFVQGYEPVEMFLFAVALAVSAIPEGLPVGMTVALGVASRRMADVGVIVRRLVAVEGLGSCTMIATDKTGTLTANELTVRQVRLPDGTTLEVTGEGYAPEGEIRHDGQAPPPDASDDLARLARAGVLCNEGSLFRRDGEWDWRGDPTDVALLTLGHKLGWTRSETLETAPQVDEIPFESEYRFAATFHDEEEGVRVAVKGAPEQIVEMCDRAVDDASFDLEQVREAATEMARDGYRVLALAEGRISDYDPREPPSKPTGLTFLGFVGMVDPIRPGVREAVERADAAGITVTMVTGDHPETALAIAEDLNLTDEDPTVVTGSDIAEADAGELVELVERVRVFARVSPGQKLDIVEAAREAGHFVAVTGDGVNDAPALTQANIGISMGRSGTDVARDASEIILSDDNFATIISGIRQGRIAYDNIRKVIYLLVSTGAGEVALVLLALAAGLPLPLAPVQLLWLNLVTNGIQDVALAFEPEEKDTLARPPRPPGERIFNRLMLERVAVAAVVMGGVGFAVFQWLLDTGLTEPAVRNQILLLFVFFEIVNIGNARSETQSILTLSPFRSPILLAGTTAAFLVHVGAMYLPPAQVVLGTEPVSLERWGLLAGIALVLAVALEAHQVWWRRRQT